MAIKTTENGTTLLQSISAFDRSGYPNAHAAGKPDEKSLDMAAHRPGVENNETIDTAAAAWEKRDYRVKADQFRQNGPGLKAATGV